MSDYRQRLKWWQNISGSLQVGAATDDTTLVTARDAFHTIFIQKITWTITTVSAGKTWTFKDSAGTPVPIKNGIPTDVLMQDSVDFGPDGYALSQGKNFLLDVSAAGAAGTITWTGYMKPTATRPA